MHEAVVLQRPPRWLCMVHGMAANALLLIGLSGSYLRFTMKVGDLRQLTAVAVVDRTEAALCPQRLQRPKDGPETLS